MKNMPDLEAWATFAKVAETGSFARTAAEFGVSQATVSKAINRLEARMKASLFHRTSRRMTLTEGGRAALARATHILDEGLALEAEVTEQSASLRGLVRVAAPMSFGVAHVAPLLPAFMRAHPEVQLDLHFDDAQVDVVAEGFDVVLRIARLEDSSLLARQLCHVPIQIVGSPAYFARHGTPRHPSDLAQLHALSYAYARSGASWRFRHATQGEFVQVMQTPLRVNNAEALTPALLAGLGVALQPAFLAWQHLQTGELVAVLPEWEPPPISLHIVTPPGRGRPARVQALIRYLADSFVKQPWAQPLPSVPQMELDGLPPDNGDA
ncbi:LysR family transcriptional regulator [Comamonas serinivorans]|uniref:LysR family transcriptional regulator n=1 Tax=Comamonas serinivorans TaxID=1082851 RepID=A0A1Y0EMA8_9BURK|nr:LysR family transcriptional regulator [Comamonas serinivorans]ARU04432.1 LysR family transcriptional regulator [Comamonas serinivorans]